ncbi:MAG: translation initiation factor IF-3 [Candidatus Ryanbacteria bacterium]|nr:translation initiation factor IF-3 [Candidatus Ryanbacteria bacterium]
MSRTHRLDVNIKNLYTRKTLVPRPRVNKQITAPEIRVIDGSGENLGVKSLEEALALALEAGLDLIEISPTARPPVARIMDNGKYQYQLEREARKSRKKAKEIEIKGIRVRLGTGTHDLVLKAKKAEEFLKEGNRVQIQLNLRGREKYLDKKFIRERLGKILEAITAPYKVSEEPKAGPRGLLMTIEPDHGKNKQISLQENQGNQNRKDLKAPPAAKSL